MGKIVLVNCPYVQRLTVSEAGRICVVKVAEIEHAEACGNYVELHLPGRTLLIRETLNRLHSLLDPGEFVRIHRSRLLRVELIDQLEPLGGGQYLVRLRNGVELMTGRAYRLAIHQALGLCASGMAPTQAPLLEARGEPTAR